MENRPKLAQLVRLSGLMLDNKISKLRAVAAEKAAIESQLATLDLSNKDALDPLNVSDAITQLTYQKWADGRRLELNRSLARQTALWLEAQDQARLEFGRKTALSTLAQRTAATGSSQ